MSAAEQASLAARQEELVRALSGQGPAPAGFDPSCLAATAESLLRKRARTVARVWPALVEALAGDFDSQFADYATCQPMPTEGGPLADGYAFGRHLAHRGELPDAARQERMAVELRYRFTRDGLIRRRWPMLKVQILRKPWRLVLAIHSQSWERWFQIGC